MRCCSRCSLESRFGRAAPSARPDPGPLDTSKTLRQHSLSHHRFLRSGLLAILLATLSIPGERGSTHAHPPDLQVPSNPTGVSLPEFAILTTGGQWKYYRDYEGSGSVWTVDDGSVHGTL